MKVCSLYVAALAKGLGHQSRIGKAKGFGFRLASLNPRV